MKPKVLYFLSLLLPLTACSVMNDEPSAETRRTDGITSLSASRAGEDDGTSKYPDGVPYRLLAFTQADIYNRTPYTPARFLRFNQVAVERETGETNHKYIQVNDVNHDFGFNPTPEEQAAETDALKSQARTIDFYGFTAGEVTAVSNDYLPLHEPTNPNGPDGYYYEQTIENETNDLQDLQWGRLYNQCLATAPAHCKIPFSHCYAQLSLEVLQEEDEATHTGKYGISIEKADILGSYDKMQVALADGRLTKPNGAASLTRTIRQSTDYHATTPLPTTIIRYGTVNLYPTTGVYAPDGSVLPDSKLELRLTLRSSNREELTRFKSGTNPNEIQTVTGETGTYYTLVLLPILLVNTLEWTNTSSSVTTGEMPLYLRSGRNYTIRLNVQQDAIYILSFIPRYIAWVNGEGNSDQDYQLQSAGSPQQFGGNIWMDRNLGATEWNPATNYARTVGYFYQQFRNIPYWPFVRGTYAIPSDATHKLPYKQYRYVENDALQFYNWVGSSTPVTGPRLFPILPDKQIKESNWWKDATTYATRLTEENDFLTWETNNPARRNFTCMKPDSKTTDASPFYTPVDWSSVANQPVPSGGWRIPSAFDFLRIFPGNPYAGNYAFRNLIQNNPTAVTDRNNIDKTYLRVCVPYYTTDMPVPALGTPYRPAYDFWKKIGDPGYMADDQAIKATVFAPYSNNPKSWIDNEIDFQSDPALPGVTSKANQLKAGQTPYVSVYLISRATDDFTENPSRQTIKGVNVGTIYAIKCYRTPDAYALRWKVRLTGTPEEEKKPTYVEVNYYRLNRPEEAILTKDTYKNLVDWEQPSATMYFPISGLGEPRNEFYHYGREVNYLTSTATNTDKSQGYVVRMKAPTGTNDNNLTISLLSGSKIFYAGQIRLVKD